MKRLNIQVTTDNTGAATAYMPRTTGKVHSITYLKDATNAYADGVDFTITAELTGESIWAESNVNATAARYPRAPTHSQAGAAALYAAGGTGVLDKVAIANDRIKIVVAQGGSAKVGRFIALLDD